MSGLQSNEESGRRNGRRLRLLLKWLFILAICVSVWFLATAPRHQHEAVLVQQLRLCQPSMEDPARAFRQCASEYEWTLPGSLSIGVRQTADSINCLPQTTYVAPERVVSCC